MVRGPFTDCWEWQGATRNGYGVLNIDHVVTYAHRFSYELHCGPLPDGAFVLHACDNRACVNPYHLSCGTQADNMRDMYAKGRGNPQGAKRKLTAEQVRAIRREARAGTNYPAIAERYGISVPAVSMIVTRKRWSHIP